jgi:AraC family transcriptional regulator, positive regulator of tynA and feaB
VSDIIFSTKSLHPCDRFSNGNDAAYKAFVEHDCQLEDWHAIEAEARSTSLGSVELSVFRNRSTTLRRSVRQITRAPGDAIFAYVQVSGTSTISQDARDITLESGGLILVDTQRPHTITYSGASEQLAAQISRSEIEARIGDISRLTALGVDDDNGVGRLASEFLQLLAARAENIPSTSRAQLGSQVVDLLSLVLSSGSAGRRWAAERL